MDQVNPTPKTAKVIRFGKFRYLAAAAILLVILAMCFLPVSQELSIFSALEDKISETFDILSSRGADGQSPEIGKLQHCMELYNSKNYEEAQVAFQDFVDSYPESDNIEEAKLYMGITQVQNGDLEQAYPTFKDLAANENFFMREDAQWYLALSYVYFRELDQAKQIFQELAESETYGEKVAAMLEGDAHTHDDQVLFR